MPPTALARDDKALADFCRAHGIRHLSVFGSTIKGTARPDSDLFGLGLDSLRAFDLLDQLADEGVQVDFAAFTVEPTVAFLSRQLPVPVP